MEGRYDANGNQTGNSAGQALTYNAKDQTTSIKPAGGTAISMAYADANQTERVSAGSTTFKSTLLGLQGETTGTASTYYTRDEAGRLVSQRTPNGTHYYLFDVLGSVVALTDSSGGVVASYSYEPYGRTTASGTVSNAWRFAAGYFDASTGLYKFGTRYYDPGLARWTQR